MAFYSLAVFFIFGLILGSFLNVVILRYHTGRFSDSQSGCLSCGAPLTPKELIPVVSFLFLRRRCQSCQSHISWQYPIVELLTGILCAAAYFFFATMYETIFVIVIGVLLIVIAVYDIKHTIIPDPFVYTFIILSLVYLLTLTPEIGFAWSFPSTTHILAGPLLFFLFWSLWFFSSGRMMGLGDAKLVLGMGWILGMTAGITAITLAFWIGAIISLLIIAYQHILLRVKLLSPTKTLTMKSEIPFAPYLIAGFLLTFFSHFDLFAHILYG